MRLWQDRLQILLAFPPRQPRLWTEADIPPDLEASYEMLLDRLLDLQPESYGDQLEPAIVHMIKAGKAAWIKFFEQYSQEQYCLNGELASAWSKLEGYTARFALILHLVRQVSDDPAVGDQIDESSLEAVVALSRWFKGEAERIYAMLGEDDEDRQRRDLIDWIRAKGGRVTARDLMRSQRRYRQSADVAERALDDLEKRGLGRWFRPPPGKHGGLPGAVFELNDTGGGNQPPLNGSKNGGSVAVAGVTTSENTSEEKVEI